MAGPLPRIIRTPDDDAEATREYFARERLQSLYDPADKLDEIGRWSLEGNDNPIAVSEWFPVSFRPCTFTAWIVPQVGANGIIFESGTSARGLAVAIDGEDIIVAMGQPAAVVGKGCSSRVLKAAPVGVRTRLTVAFLTDGPGGATINVWVDGLLRGAAQSADTDLGGPNLGSADMNIAVPGVEGVIDRIPVAQQVALANCAIVSPVSQYGFGTLPQQFQNGLSLGLDTSGDADYESRFTPLPFIPTHTLTVGDDAATRFGFRNGFAGAIDPTTFEGSAIDQYYSNQSTNIFQIGKVGATKWLGNDFLTTWIEGYNGGAPFVVEWDFIFYDTVDPALFTYLSGNVGAELAVRIELGDVT